VKRSIHTCYVLSITRQTPIFSKSSLHQNLYNMKKNVFVAMFLMTSAITLFGQKSEVFKSSNQAIRGYDPVAYFTAGKPVKGDQRFTFHWKEADWYFSSKEDLNLFMKDPQKYAPQYGGYCAYGMSEAKKAPTDPSAWTIVNGKLYLNYSLQVEESWKKNQKQRIGQADKNWPQIKNEE
jgi:YHS domain-containing protein